MLRKIHFLLLLLVSSSLVAQSICDDDTCSDELERIELNQPRDPADGSYTAARTDAFKQAYDQFKQIKDQQEADAGFRDKFRTSALGGRKCLLYYDLDSRFAYEAEKNPDFKAYVAGKEVDPDAYMRHAFESSRRGMNLQRRLDDNCPREIRKSEKDGTATLDDRRAVYQELGVQQGYWDRQGNTLKQLEAIPAAEPVADSGGRKSKKQQVEELTQAVNALPVGQDTKDKINKLAQDAGNLAPKADELVEKLNKTQQTLTDLLPKPGGLADQIGKLLGLKKPLSSYVPKIPGSGIVEKIKSWFGKGKKLKERADKLAGDARNLKNQLDDTVKKAKQTAADLKKQAEDIADLNRRQQALEDKKNDLVAKLGDKPKKILEQLHQEVGDARKQAKEIADEIAAGGKNVGKLRDELDKLNQKREQLEDKIDDVQQQVQDIAHQEEQLKQEGDQLQQQADRLDRQAELKDQVDAVAAAGTTSPCTDELASLLAGLEKVEEKKKKRKFSLGRILSAPARLLGKVTAFIDKHAGLKAILGAIPGVSNVINVVDGLFGRSKALAGILDAITGKQGKLTQRLEDITRKVDGIRKVYDDKVKQVTDLTEKARKIADEKTALAAVLAKPLDDLTDAEARVVDLVNRAKNGTLPAGDAPCNEVEPQLDELEEIDSELDEMEPEIAEMEEQLVEAETEVNQIEEETAAVEQEVAEIVEQQEEIQQEEEAIKEQFGQDVDLEPVSVQEWSESFEVQRPYWEATFHPDDEVVEGYRGRYFQVQLKDADKAVKLLFGPGEYHMSKSDFRDQYGSVIGAFVTEALAAIKKDQRAGVKLFVQGSADISGATSFRGNLDESFYYDQLNLLPLKGSENFGGTEESRDVPERGFTNEDLPNLRGRFMQEMIGFYSKKLQPILLEGSVKEKVDEEDRNAVIYLFLPESLIGE